MEPPKKRSRRQNPSKNTSHKAIAFSDDVIDNIFSFIPIKKAVKLGVTSTRQRDTWKVNRILDFGKKFIKRGLAREDYISIVDHVLGSHLGSKVRTFRLYFDQENESARVEGWIHFAVSKEVEELDLDFSLGNEAFELPIELLNFSSIVSLNLCFCRLTLSENFNGLNSLTHLILRRVHLSDSFIESVFHYCGSLEIVELTRCSGLSNLKISAIQQKKFSMLKVRSYHHLVSFNVNAPTLSFLHYNGCIPNGVSIGNVSELKSAIFCFKDLRPYNDLISVLFNVSHVNILTMNRAFIEGIRRAPICLENLKELQLVLGGRKNTGLNPYGLALFLRNCPYLENAFLDFNDFYFDRGHYWELNDKKPFMDLAGTFDHLKLVKVKGLKLEMMEFIFFEYLLGKAPILERLALITPRGSGLNISVNGIENYLQWFESWKLSPNCQITVLPNSKNRSCFQPRHRKLL